MEMELQSTAMAEVDDTGHVSPNGYGEQEQKQKRVRHASSVVIVDAFALIHPHSTRAVCKNHYLCWSSSSRGSSNKDASGLHWDTLPAGVALAESVLLAVCDE